YMTGLTDITHYDLFRILDYLKVDCQKRNKNEPLGAVKYADIFNFAGSCREFRRIVRHWSKPMYDDLEIDLLQEVPHSHLTVKFEEIHKSLKGATAKKVDKYLDIYIRAMLKNPLLKTLELRHNSQSCFSYHQYMFDEIVLAICGQSKRAVLAKDRLPKVIEITVDIAGNNLSALANTRIGKLKLTASFAISDLKEFCARNPALVTLEINAYSFTDHGQLNQIVGHCPALKQLKFVMSDNARDTEYVKLALLEKLQHLEIAIQPVQIMDFGWDEDHNYEDIASKRARLDSDHENYLTLANSTPLLLLIKALSERKKSKLVQLRLMFKINDDVVQAIAQLKGLRLLECGFCDTKSIQHLKRHPTLNRLVISERDDIITEDIADLLRKQVTVSNSFTKMFFNQRGHLYIETKNAVLFSYISLDPLLRLENLKSLWLSDDLLVQMGKDLHLFLELGVQI
ncbi:hypothetical protein KR054_009757, partial [Drosophila jambulina]